ncbi:serine hydrolase domain-containing protein [Sandarakinorhabdus sp. DWP1-3-1]|uniref:serine hydrolase domain-containing protein n=1 Tax=Sandarakinorhabdus sp. DWP1-3-1 TaxID=2804627 RepID=UPI003CF4042F
MSGAFSRAVLAVLLATAAPVAAATPVTASQQRLAGLADFVDGVMAQQIATREVAGAVVTVVHDGRVLFTRGYGFADVGKGIAVDGAATLFRPGSVSKMFTWAALLQQIELGRVDLDADVNAYLDFKIPPFEGKPILVRHLLSHTPGISDVSGITAPTVDKLTPYGDWIKTHIPERRWPAGTEVSYSNYGAALAGYIVERVSGEPFADYADRHIFKPLGMTSTTFREPLPAALAPRMASGYRLEEGRLTPKPFELFSSIMPAGSATSSAPDMNRFMLALLNGGGAILKPASVRLLESDSIANAPDLPGMAHGFFVLRAAAPRIVGHGGNTGDFHSNMILVPEARLGFFISETGGQGSYGGRTELTEALIGRLFPQAPSPRVAAAAGEAIPAGAYRMNRRDYSRPANPAYDLAVSADGNNALTVVNDGQTTRWNRIGPMLYEKATGARAGGPYERLRFFGDEGRRRLSFSSLPHVTYHLVTP